jgi:hypothetical protein
VIWLQAPRLSGITGQGLDPKVLAYLLQGVAYPFAAGLARLPHAWLWRELVIILGLAWALLMVGAWRCGHGRSALLASGLILCGLAPIYVGLPWDYVKIGSRLLYSALLGTAALWGLWLAPLVECQATPLRRVTAIALAFTLLSVAGAQWYGFQRLYRLGTRHLAEAIEVIASHPADRLVFVNFPDQIEIKRPLYPLGWWGLVLAPVVQDLADFSEATTGQAAQTHSLALPADGYIERQASPYETNLRGQEVISAPLWQEATQSDGVYLSVYGEKGDIRLIEIGSVAPETSQPPLVTLGDRVNLVSSRTRYEDSQMGVLLLELEWRIQRPCGPEDTFFVHLLNTKGQLITECDGDAFAGLLPLEYWQTGWVVRDIRRIPLTGLKSGDYAVTLGAYNRNSGERWPAIWPDGARALNDEPQIETITIP